MSEEFEKKLQQKIAEIRPADRDSMEAAKAHWRTVGQAAQQSRETGRGGSAYGRDQRESGLYDREKRSCLSCVPTMV